MYYVYKIWVEGHPDVYIGATNNTHTRMLQHKRKVANLMPLIFAGKKVPPCKIKAYPIFAKQCLKGKRLGQWFSTEKMQMEILFQSESWQEVEIKEREFIAKYADRCHNTVDDSSYRPIRKKISNDTSDVRNS